MPQTNTNQQLTDVQTGLLLRVEPLRGFGLSCLEPLLHDHSRNRDINGRGIAEVMSKTGWHFRASPVLATARDPSTQTAVAAAWCGPIQWQGAAQRIGLNLSYATAENWTGKGLPGLLSALAFTQLQIESGTQPWDLNIQCDEQNTSSQKAAMRMPFVRHPDADFDVPALGRRYMGFTCPNSIFTEYAKSLIESRIEEINDVVYIKERR